MFLQVVNWTNRFEITQVLLMACSAFWFILIQVTNDAGAGPTLSTAVTAGSDAYVLLCVFVCP